MGGYRSWEALARRPDLFAAAMPLCGGADPATAAQIKHIPIACFHGSKDQVVVPEKSRRMIEALRAVGSKPVYVEYPEAAHDSWSETYATEDNIQWLFDQRRDPANASK